MRRTLTEHFPVTAYGLSRGHAKRLERHLRMRGYPTKRESYGMHVWRVRTHCPESAMLFATAVTNPPWGLIRWQWAFPEPDFPEGRFVARMAHIAPCGTARWLEP